MATTTHANQGAVPLILAGTSIPSQFQNSSNLAGNQNEFPVRTIKILLSVQIGLGILLGILSLIGTILDGMALNNSCGYPNYYYYYGYSPCWNWDGNDYFGTLFAFDFTCLVLSSLYIAIGALLLHISRKQKNYWGRRMKYGFLICCIIGASVIAPTMFGLSVAGAIKRGKEDIKTVAIPAFIAVLSFAELIASILGASYYCYTFWKTANQSFAVIYIPQTGMIVNLRQTPMTVCQNQPNVCYAGQSGNSIHALYPTQQQYQVIAQNALLMPATQFEKTNLALSAESKQPLVAMSADTKQPLIIL